MILLAAEVLNPPQDSLGLLPITVQRNAYGRQVDSFVTPGKIRLPRDLAADVRRLIGRQADEVGQTDGQDVSTEFVFIRAPRITRVHHPVEVLARHEGAPILVRQGHVLAGSFHPELTADDVVTSIFVAMVGRARAQPSGGDGGPGGNGGGGDRAGR
jgi:5'-phosphate synthase pdxT subunit